MVRQKQLRGHPTTNFCWICCVCVCVWSVMFHDPPKIENDCDDSILLTTFLFVLLSILYTYNIKELSLLKFVDSKMQCMFRHPTTC